MSAYEITYLILVGIQTVFLIWYAFETMKLRKNADKQTDAVARQVQASIDAIRIQENQAKATIDALKLQEEQYRNSLEPVFEITFKINAGARFQEIHNAKENATLLELRCNVIFETPSFGGTTDRSIRQVHIDVTHVLYYLGVKYRDFAGNVKTKVFEIQQVQQTWNERTDYNYATLPFIEPC